MRLIFSLLFLISLSTFGQSVYVGSEKCGECHEDVYNSFMQFSSKAKSFASILKMKKGLTESEFQNCFKCHTTGYSESGFKSEKETPLLKNVGCESCHGKGSVHSESEKPSDINRRPTIDVCNKCHLEGYGKRNNVVAGAH